MIRKREKSRRAVAFQLDPHSNELFMGYGRPADQLFYSQVDTPTNPQPHEHGLDARMSLEEHQRMVDRCLGGEIFGMSVTRTPEGLVVARVEVPYNTMEATALEKYARWALEREGVSVEEEGLPDLARQISLDGEGPERVFEVVDNIDARTLSLRCLGLKVKGLPPVGRERFQVVEGERKDV